MEAINANIGKPLPVHKQGEEGIIEIDSITGAVRTPTDEQPAWADGLVTALLDERRTFYMERVGKVAYANHFGSIDSYTYEDLGWVGLDEEGDEVEIEADPEFRQDVLATILGIDRSNEKAFDNALLGVEIELKTPHSEEDLGVLEAAQSEVVEPIAKTA